MSQQIKILVIEDDPDIIELLTSSLEMKGYQVETCNRGDLAVDMALALKPDLLILDWMLPGLEGPEIIKKLRQNPHFTPRPILMLTARASDDDTVLGLEVGADDYITKPFSIQVLNARIKRALKQYDQEVVPMNESIHGIEIDSQRHVATIQGKEIFLTASEFKALQFLMAKPGWVFNRNQIMVAVHGEGYFVSERAIDVMIVGLRKKMGDSGKLIETVRGVGYRMID